MNRILTPILLLLAFGNIFACEPADNENERQFLTLVDKVEQSAPKTADEGMIAFANAMLGTEYAGGTLEGDKEKLIIHFDRTDCILFVESAVAFTETFFSENRTYADYERNVQELRYRNGKITDYTSRIHYTSEWLKQAEKNGTLKEITADICRELGIGTYQENISFMSENSNLYPALAQHPEMVPAIRKVESELNRDTYYVIPKERIARASHLIRNGDIIAFNTRIKGLDISHVGIAWWDHGKLTFIHASSAKKKVIVNEKPLSDYCNASRNCDGIRVARVIEQK